MASLYLDGYGSMDGAPLSTGSAQTPTRTSLKLSRRVPVSPEQRILRIHWSRSRTILWCCCCGVSWVDDDDDDDVDDNLSITELVLAVGAGAEAEAEDSSSSDL